METILINIIIGSISILVCALPFILSYKSRKKTETLMFQSLSKIATQNNCKISKHDFCSAFAIGVDDSKKMVFFYKKENNTEINEYVDLKEIKKSIPVKTTRTIGNSVIHETIELSFVSFSKNIDKKFLFYSDKANDQLSDELKLVEHWSTYINSII